MEMRDYDYAPATIAVAPGEAIRFVNVGQEAHTATSQTRDRFDTGQVPPGGARNLTFAEAGRFPIWCVNHAGRNAPDAPFTGMVGEVIVATQSPARPAPGPALVAVLLVGLGATLALARRG